MVYIKSAYFGDERSSKNVTETVKDKIADGKINVLADSSLLPMFEVGGEIALTQQEEEDARDEATQQCGGNANDTDCIDAKVQDIQRSKLEDKENQAQSRSNIVKGRRLTVNVIDDNGKTRTLLVPDGQYFKLEGLKLDAQGNIVELPTAESSWKYALFLAGSVVYWLFQTFGTIGAYKTLNGYSYINEFSFIYRETEVNLPLLLLIFILFTMPFGGIVGLLIMFFAPLIFGEPKLV
jgi:hypothetical protein